MWKPFAGEAAEAEKIAAREAAAQAAAEAEARMAAEVAELESQANTTADDPDLH